MVEDTPWQQRVVVHEHFKLLSQGLDTVLGYSQGRKQWSRVPGSALGSSSGKSFVLFWDIMSLWPVTGWAFFPVWSHREAHWKRKKRDALQSKEVLHPMFCFCHVATVQLRVWMRFLMCVFEPFGTLKLLYVCFWCSAQPRLDGTTRHWRSQEQEGLGVFIPVRGSNLALNRSLCSQCGWQK